MMTNPNDDDDERPRVQVFRRYDDFGRLCDPLEVDEDAAGHWDATRWRDRPPL